MMASVLIIDDNREFRRMLERVLTRVGHRTASAAGGHEGLQRFRDCPADVVITDIVMPEGEGVETILALRKLRPRCRIIAVSGGGFYGPERYLHLAERFGADRIFSKPVHPDELIGAIAALAEARPALRLVVNNAA